MKSNESKGDLVMDVGVIRAAAERHTCRSLLCSLYHHQYRAAIQGCVLRPLESVRVCQHHISQSIPTIQSPPSIISLDFARLVKLLRDLKNYRNEGNLS